MKHIIIVFVTFWFLLFIAGKCEDCTQCPEPTQVICDSLYPCDTCPEPNYDSLLAKIDSLQNVINSHNPTICDSIVPVDSVVYDTTYINCPEEGDEKIIFSENFETLPDMKYSTLIENWKPLFSFYWEGSQSIVDVGGTHGKVWNSIYHQGREAQADGFELFIPFNDTLSEIYFETTIRTDSLFNGYSTLCYYSGKIMQGVYGGRTPLYLCNPWCLDSLAYGNGWGLDGEWGSAEGGCYSGNPNVIWPYYGDAEGYYKTLRSYLMLMPRGEWVRWTRRVKINTIGKADGILEWYINGVLVMQRTDVIWRSVAAGKAKQNNVDGILLRFTTGGGSGPNYISSRDNVLQLDGLVAYLYLEGSKNYLPGPAPAGHRIPIIGKANNELANVYPEPTFSDESFTASQGTIQSHYSGVFHVPQSFNIYTKTISVNADQININFTYWHDGFNNGEGSDCWVKIYSGIGDNKVLLRTFQEDADDLPGPVIGTTYIVPGGKATIEYYPGRDFSAGWKLHYMAILNSDEVLAFPSAVGFGKYTRGAYAGSSTPRILIVNTLGDVNTGDETTGKGSFRWCITRSYPRVVLFEVSGYINLTSNLYTTSPYMSIYGQTAPSPGITIRYYPAQFNASEFIVQHLRFRLSDDVEPEDSHDALDIYKGRNIYFDHISASWGIDEVFSPAQPNNMAYRLTISNSIISEGLHSELESTPHSYGTVNTYSDSITWIYNLWAHLQDRAPLFGENTTNIEIINNLLYNTSGSTTGGLGNNNIYQDATYVPAKVHIIGNEYIKGLNSANNYTIRLKETFASGTKDYILDNGGPNENPADPWAVVSCTTKAVLRSDVPLFISWVTPIPHALVESYVLSNVGARPWDRDAVDTRIINDVINHTGVIVHSESEVGGFPPLVSNTRILTVPVNPHVDDNGNGYTNLEEWIWTFEQ